MSIPKIGRRDSELKELGALPSSTTIGEIPLQPTPSTTSTTWVSEDVPITITEPPPPWEVDPQGERVGSDARRFVKCPENVVLRWVNPRLVNVIGLRNWQAVPAKDDYRFKLLVSSMGHPDNTVRRGDGSGDFLVWMYRSWYESRQSGKAAKVAKLTQSAVDRALNAEEAVRRSAASRYIKDVHVTHPTHTMAEGKTLGKD